MANNAQIAADVLAAVGGKENVSSVTHCMTRLRFILKDAGVPKDDEVKKIKGVIGVAKAGGQYQVIIGQNVAKVYDEVCKLGGFAASAAIDENLDKEKPKEKLTAKKIGSNIMNYLSGSMTPLLPIMLAAGMFKTIIVVFGPTMLNLLQADSSLYILFDFMYDAGFYFLPIFLGYHAAKKIGATPALGMYMGAILIAPDLIALVSAGEPFAILGVSMRLVNYSQSVLPILLSVVLLYYVEKLCKKIIPDALASVFVPTFTILITTPIALCALAPLGSILADYLSILLNAIATYGGFVGKGIIAAVWEFLVMTGMHVVLVLPAMATLMADGFEGLIFVCGKCAVFATIGMSIGAFFRIKDKDERSETLGYFISAILGGVTEPILYGIGLRYMRPFVGMVAGGLVGGAYAGLMHVGVYTMSPANILSFTGFIGDSQANLVNGIIAIVLSMVVSAVVTYFFGFEKKTVKDSK